MGDLLWRTQERYEGTRWADVARRERERVLPLVREIKPVGPGLVVISSEGADVLEVQPLPAAVEDHSRVGLGVYALPLLDLIDESEPVAVAFVENDKARLLLVSAGRVVEAQHFTADVPAREKAGGWHAASHARHRREVARRHLHDVAEALETFQEKHTFRRLLLAGPTEPLTAFKNELSPPIAHLVLGELGIDAHASDAHVAVQVAPVAQRLERETELRAVQELIVASEKGQGGVTGVEQTLAAMHNHELHSLVIDPSVGLEGALCPKCDRLHPTEASRCTECQGPVERVDLREELPRHLPSRQIVLEMVHGDAASDLLGYGSIGGMLKVNQH
jgi:peptide subunit release factor 1 (eRF1)